MTSRTVCLLLGALALPAFSGCDAAPAEPQPNPVPPSEIKPAPTQNAAAPVTATPKLLEPPKPVKRKISKQPVAEAKPAEDDPLKGVWTMADATKGLPPGKEIIASIETSLGTLQCKLFDDKAPINVANFVGLARGIRPWKTPAGKWEKKPIYDGSVFHRIMKGFMIQGGDPLKTGMGDAGYEIPDEIWEDANHDRAGLLCMANHGPNTASSQFFITDDAAFHLDGGYTILGECSPVDTVHKLASVEVQGELAKDPPVIKKVTVTRK